jgi:Fe-S-cluster containining protein
MSQDPPSSRIPAELKSELCGRCGKCCMSAAFWLGPINGAESWDHVRWIQLHGLKVDIAPVGSELYYGVQFPTPCRELRRVDGRYVCGIYESRPAMCRQYDCTDSEPTLFKIQDTAWNVWLRENPAEPEASADL